MARSSFHVVSRLGIGGMGEVYLALWDRPDGQQRVALKRIRPEFAGDRELQAHFEREARIGASLRHPNIVEVLAYGKDDLGPYLALEYVDGTTASRLMRALPDGPPPLGMGLSIGLDVARALAYAHGTLEPDSGPRPVIHRDVSPDNILVTREGVAKLADFGIAKVAGGTQLTTTGKVKGKLGFMAPELFHGGAADERTDVFSFAASFFLLLSGVPPFQGKNEAELTQAILSAAPPKISALRPDLPDALAQLLERALARAPEQRPTNWTEWLDLLKALTEARPTHADDVFRDALARAIAAQSSAKYEVASTWASRVPSTQKVLGRSTSRRAGLAFGAGAVLAAATLLAIALNRLRPRAETAPVPAAVRMETTSAPVSPPPVPVAQPTPAAASPLPSSMARATAPRKGSLWVKASPWARVLIDGERVGDTPLPPVPLAAGAHRVTLINPELGVRRTVPVTLRPGERRELKVVLDK